MRCYDYGGQKHFIVSISFGQFSWKIGNLCKFNGIFVGLQSTLNPNIERTTRAIDMIASAFDRYDVTLSNTL